VRFLRRQHYDAALDLQGLIKSAVLARASGARRVIGFSAGHLREPVARVFYGDTVEPAAGVHVVWKNLAVVRALGIEPAGLVFPLGASLDAAMAEALPPPDASGAGTFAVVNPGAGWPNTRWAPERFGAVAAHLASRHGLRSLVTWGPGEQALAEAVVRASDGAARCAPSTGLGDLIALLGRARIFVGGDTGPLQLAAALGTPTVAVFGPTNPARNGSWLAADVSLSRFDTCECHHKRRCRRATPCIDDIGVGEVLEAVDRRLGIGDWGLGAGERQGTSPNRPQSPTPNPQPPV
jgi:ADP-heptose:LPS heptosyltransferase